MFGTVANGTLPARKYICSPLKSKVSILGFRWHFWFVIGSIAYQDWVLKFFTSGVFLSDNHCPKYPNFWLRTYSWKHSFLQCILLSWSELTKMSDNSNNVHFSGVRFICSPYLAIKLALASLGPIMARCGPQMNLPLRILNAFKMH